MLFSTYCLVINDKITKENICLLLTHCHDFFYIYFLHKLLFCKIQRIKGNVNKILNRKQDGSSCVNWCEL